MELPCRNFKLNQIKSTVGPDLGEGKTEVPGQKPCEEEEKTSTHT